MGDILILSELNLAEKARLIRISKRMRQIDIASVAKVQPNDVINLEKGRFLSPRKKVAILRALGMEEETKSLIPRRFRKQADEVVDE